MRISGRKHFIGGLVIGLAILGAVPRSAAQQAITPTAKELNRAFDADGAPKHDEDLRQPTPENPGASAHGDDLVSTTWIPWGERSRHKAVSLFGYRVITP